jgi:peptide/nickel transport system substrate-binding protein
MQAVCRLERERLMKKLLTWSTAFGALMSLVLSASAVWAGQSDDTLRVALSRETDFIDSIHTSSADSDLFGTIIFDTLIYADRATGEFKPLLASSWIWTSDKTVEFKLRQGIKFQNGETFNADDVVFTFKQLMDMNNKFRQQQQDFGNIASVEKLDEYTVKLSLKQPEPTFENVLASRVGIWPNEYTEANGHMIHATKPVGTGPYALKSMQKGSSYTLVKNDNYFGGTRPKPTIGTIEIRVIPETQTQIAELMSGGIDMALSLSPSDATALQGAPGVVVQTGQATRMYFLSMNVAGKDSNPLSNADVRRAISYAVNKPEMVHSLVSPDAAVLATNCNPSQRFCITDIKPVYEFNLAKARELMKSAGYAGGFDVTLMAEANIRAIGEALQGYLSAIGIRVRLETMPLPAWRERYIKGESQMSIVGWGSGVTSLDISNTLGIFFNGSSTDYVKDKDITEWNATALRTTDKGKREELYRNTLTRINEQAYVLPLYGTVATYSLSEPVRYQAPVIDFPDISLASWAK